MKTYYYKKRRSISIKKAGRFGALFLCVVGSLVCIYIFLPLISWQVYFAPIFASQAITAPIPQATVINSITVKSLLAEAAGAIGGVDYTNAHNWFPGLKLDSSKPKTESYSITIPKISVFNAQVSTIDYDLSSHLVNYGGTAVPPANGNAVIFGHSTLPQLFNPKDYKTIFANAYKLEIGAAITALVSGVSYTYKIYSITVVDAKDTSIFAQNYDNSYLTLVTCTPPGTTWKRLIIRARLQKLT